MFRYNESITKVLRTCLRWVYRAFAVSFNFFFSFTSRLLLFILTFYCTFCLALSRPSYRDRRRNGHFILNGRTCKIWKFSKFIFWFRLWKICYAFRRSCFCVFPLITLVLINRCVRLKLSYELFNQSIRTLETPLLQSASYASFTPVAFAQNFHLRASITDFSFRLIFDAAVTSFRNWVHQSPVFYSFHQMTINCQKKSKQKKKTLKYFNFVRFLQSSPPPIFGHPDDTNTSAATDVVETTDKWRK